MKQNDNWIVYKHISPSNKVYVGITQIGIQRRWGVEGRGYLNKTNGKYVHPLFAMAILKYGWDNFQHRIIATNLGESTAKNIEIDMIRFYKNRNLSYNVTDGGDGRLGTTFTHTQEAKDKIKLHHRKCQTPETIEKLRLINIGRKNSEELKLHFREAHSKERIAIYQYDSNYVLLNEYSSIMDAARSTNIPSGNITNSCKHKGSAGGYIWRYKVEGLLTAEDIADLKKSKEEEYKKSRRKAARKAAETRKTRDNRSHVLQFDLFGNLIAEYKNIDIAAEAINKSVDTIRRCIKSKQKYVEQYIYTYKENETKNIS